VSLKDIFATLPSASNLLIISITSILLSTLKKEESQKLIYIWYCSLSFWYSSIYCLW